MIATMPEFLTLNQIYDGDTPHRDEMLWEFIGIEEFDVPFEVITINPVEVFNTFKPDGSMTMREIFAKRATKAQKAAVKRLREKAAQVQREKIAIVCEGILVDGWHSVSALALEKITSLRAIDLCRPQADQA